MSGLRPLFGYREGKNGPECSNENMVPYVTKTGRNACKFPKGWNKGKKRGPRTKIGGDCFWDSTRSKYYKKVNGRTRWLMTDRTCDNRGSVTSVDWKKGGYTRAGGRSVWNDFVSDNYATVRQANPAMSMGEIMKELSKLYKAQKASAAMQVSPATPARPAIPARPSARARRSFNTQMKKKRRNRDITFDAGAIVQTQKLIKPS